MLLLHAQWRRNVQGSSLQIKSTPLLKRSALFAPWRQLSGYSVGRWCRSSSAAARRPDSPGQLWPKGLSCSVEGESQRACQFKKASLGQGERDG